MKTSAKALLYLLLLIPFFSQGQFQNYSYQREVLGVTDQWHKLTLPEAFFDKVDPSLNDLRIIGISSSGDTTEVPYLLKLDAGRTIEKEVEFSVINKSQNGKNAYITFALPTAMRINRMMLDIELDNFDWRIDLESSNDQKQWFVILNDYRILSIKNTQTNFRFTQLDFPDSEYLYYRIRFNGVNVPAFKSAHLKFLETEDGRMVSRPVKAKNIHEEKNTDNTLIDLKLEHKVPVSEIVITVEDAIDFYRPIFIEYLSDSFETEKGWRYNYRSLYSGTLSSFLKPSFRFPVALAKNFRITIRNGDNEPLHISDVAATGYNYILYARFTEKGTFFLLYGNSAAYSPRYDLTNFEESIPENLVSVELGDEQKIKPQLVAGNEPMFLSMYWLWLIIGAVGVVLVYFTLKMMKTK
jgi:hypothetical protein